MSELDWAAGLFEGEGTVTFKKPGMLGAQLASTDEDVVRRFHVAVGVGRVGGPYGPYSENRKAFWKWYANGSAAASALASLRDQLGERRGARVDEAVGAWHSRQTQPHYTVSRAGMGGRPTHRKEVVPPVPA